MKIHEKLEKYFYKVKKLGDNWNYSLEEVLPDDDLSSLNVWRKDRSTN